MEDGNLSSKGYLKAEQTLRQQKSMENIDKQLNDSRYQQAAVSIHSEAGANIHESNEVRGIARLQ